MLVASQVSFQVEVTQNAQGMVAIDDLAFVDCAADSSDPPSSCSQNERQ